MGNSGLLFPELGYLIPFVVHKVLFPIDPGPIVKKEKARTSQHWILGFPLSLRSGVWTPVYFWLTKFHQKALIFYFLLFC
jgi:hypothetical protein